MSKLSFAKDVRAAVKGAEVVFYVAPKKTFDGGWLKKVASGASIDLAHALALAAKPGTGGTLETVATGEKSPKKIVLGILPDSVSRHNSPTRHEAIAALAAKSGIAGAAKAAVILGLDDADHYTGAATAIARALPIFTRKNQKTKNASDVLIAATDAAGKDVTADGWVEETAHGARWTAQMVDTHPAELTTADFAREAKKFVKGLKGVTAKEITGPALLKLGLNGIHSVGRTAMVAPRLLILDYKPARASKTYALVGKGIIYDTGGLALKVATGMCTMKGDMGGGAACVGAFRTLVANGFKDRLICAVPLAENAIGPDSYRNDDILTMHSKKTVEINNTDAEGRILLADALSYVCRTYSPAAVMNAATLTGAQLVSSGVRHASIVSNREGFENLALRAGRASGDLCHALLFAPEFLMSEFDSKFADMTNSVHDRSNAQSSCAAMFVHAHIEDLNVPWLHIDLAGPSWRDGRGSGYGVALMSTIFRTVTGADLAE